MENQNKDTKLNSIKSTFMVSERIREFGLLLPLIKVYLYICTSFLVYAYYFSNEDAETTISQNAMPLLNGILKDLGNVYMTLGMVFGFYVFIFMMVPLEIRRINDHFSKDKSVRSSARPVQDKTSFLQFHALRALTILKVYLLFALTTLGYLFYYKHQDPELMYSDSLLPFFSYCYENITGIFYSASIVYGAYFLINYALPFLVIKIYKRLKQ